MSYDHWANGCVNCQRKTPSSNSRSNLRRQFGVTKDGIPAANVIRWQDGERIPTDERVNYTLVLG